MTPHPKAPLPQAGGSYIRRGDGSLGPAGEPEAPPPAAPEPAAGPPARRSPKKEA